VARKPDEKKRQKEYFFWYKTGDRRLVTGDRKRREGKRKTGTQKPRSF
jgi:hypothetical protein